MGNVFPVGICKDHCELRLFKLRVSFVVILSIVPQPASLLCYSDPEGVLPRVDLADRELEELWTRVQVEFDDHCLAWVNVALADWRFWLL